MQKPIQEIFNRIPHFDDSLYLAEWIEQYREDLRDSDCTGTEMYYLEEVRQNLVGLFELTMELVKYIQIQERQIKEKQKE